MGVVPCCPIHKHHLGMLTGAGQGSIWGKDFNSDRTYAVRLLIPAELNRCLSVFVEMGFGPDFDLPVEEKNSVVSLRDGMMQMDGQGAALEDRA